MQVTQWWQWNRRHMLMSSVLCIVCSLFPFLHLCWAHLKVFTQLPAPFLHTAWQKNTSAHETCFCELASVTSTTAALLSTKEVELRVLPVTTPATIGRLFYCTDFVKKDMRHLKLLMFSNLQSNPNVTMPGTVILDLLHWGSFALQLPLHTTAVEKLVLAMLFEAIRDTHQSCLYKFPSSVVHGKIPLNLWRLHGGGHLVSVVIDVD